jgi:hypothetical protein
MARDINARLNSLNTRRRGLDRLDRLTEDASAQIVRKSFIQEAWQKRAVGKPHSQYAIGAMQAVDPDYTRIGVETADRVSKQLAAGLTTSVEFRLQGSVPLDVHVRGVSDVDLLTLDTSFYTYATFGVRSVQGYYTNPTTRTSLGVLGDLRRQAEPLLKAKYPAATVDCSGGKCIALSGGSLARPVDVVPAHWNDTMAYQASGAEHDRGVTILNKKVPETIDNLPFTHIKRVHDRDGEALGGLKKAIRLTKNVKNDAENEARAEKLPSFDIAALLYHADKTALMIGYLYELNILIETRRFLDWCWANPTEAGKLRTPCGSRFILDSDAKRDGLLAISMEMDDLARRVAIEHVPSLGIGTPTWPQVEAALKGAVIAAAA